VSIQASAESWIVAEIALLTAVCLQLLHDFLDLLKVAHGGVSHNNTQANSVVPHNGNCQNLTGDHASQQGQHFRDEEDQDSGSCP